MQQSRTEDPEINPYSCSYLIFDEEPKIHIGENTVSSTACPEKTGYLHAED
jgi:hypothetical protein